MSRRGDGRRRHGDVADDLERDDRQPNPRRSVDDDRAQPGDVPVDRGGRAAVERAADPELKGPGSHEKEEEIPAAHRRRERPLPAVDGRCLRPEHRPHADVDPDKRVGDVPGVGDDRAGEIDVGRHDHEFGRDDETPPADGGRLREEETPESRQGADRVAHARPSRGSQSLVSMLELSGRGIWKCRLPRGVRPVRRRVRAPRRGARRPGRGSGLRRRPASLAPSRWGGRGATSRPRVGV